MDLQKKSSTYMALLKFIDKVIQTIENGEYAVGVFWISQRPLILLTIKLCWTNYIIMESELYTFWFRSYLSHILQYVTYNGS